MMNARNATILSVLAASMVLFSGCALFMGSEAPPKRRVVNMDYVGEQSVKYLVNRYEASTTVSQGDVMSGGDAEVSTTILYDVSVEVCDIDGQRDESKCKSTNVLRAVAMSGGPYTEEYQPATNERWVTSMYWYDAQTLYVAYLNVGPSVRKGSGPTPRIKKCKVGENNSLNCSKSGDVNSKLFIQETSS